MRFVCLSDNHGAYDFDIPDGDVLIHAGDLTNIGGLVETATSINWLKGLPHRYKISIAGNHDWLFYKESSLAKRMMADAGILYLEDSGVTIDGNCILIGNGIFPGQGITIYGSPYSPSFCNWAFGLDRGAPIKEKWETLPSSLDVLVTHGPPKGILDKNPSGEHVGCEDLANRLKIIKPSYHCFGHIHHGYGIKETTDMTFINCSVCDEMYNTVNPPQVFDI